MRDVLYALAPATLASLWFFGISAVLIIGTCIFGAVLAEWLFADRSARSASLHDSSGILTGLLLGLTLPPGLPMWMAFLGGFVAISLGKVIWGGLGHNLFNPALLGRAFLLATFPIAMTTWVPTTGDSGFFSIYPGNLALPFMQAQIDGITSATPLGMMKFDQVATPLADLAFGNVSGSLGDSPGAVQCGTFPGAAILGLLRRSVARRNLHGNRSGHLTDNAQGHMDLRHRRGRPGDVDPGLRWPPRGRDVRHPADERGNAADQSLHAAHGVRARG
jgi:Na+-translocating ferredoxin:NAD+ oxidoreductase RnfD subunit